MLADPAQLLAAWEEGSRAEPVARVAVLVHRAGLAEDIDSALDLPIGRGATMAARLHAEMFGAEVEGIVRCGVCGEDLDVTVPLAGLADEGGSRADVAGLVVRALTIRDLLVAGAAGDARRELLARCVSDRHGQPVELEELDAERLGALDEAAEDLAGAAGTVLRGNCPACGGDATAPLDVGALLWEQVARSARALLAEVAELGAVFGWSEQDVLALTPLRRREYLRFAWGEA
jgi:hypothetical protein